MVWGGWVVWGFRVCFVGGVWGVVCKVYFRCEVVVVVVVGMRM